MKKILFLFAFIFSSVLSFAGGKEEVIEIKTKYGNIYIWLYKDTPKHRQNFIDLANKKFYDSTSFHRVIKDFMIQGGDPFSKIPEKKDSVGNGEPGYTLEAEILSKHFHKRGVLAAARMGDDVNPTRRSSGCQFYIVQGKKFTEAELRNAEVRITKALKREFVLSPEAKKAYMEVGGTPWLDEQYTAFGEVLSGMEVVDKIADVKTVGPNRPVQDIRMDVNVLKFNKKKFKKKFGTIPDGAFGTVRVNF